MFITLETQDAITQFMKKSIPALIGKKKQLQKSNKGGKMLFPAGLEPATFRVWGGRDNHYTTETSMSQYWF